MLNVVLLTYVHISHCCLYDKNVVVQIIVIMSNDDCCYDRSINLENKKDTINRLVAHARAS